MQFGCGHGKGDLVWGAKAESLFGGGHVERNGRLEVAACSMVWCGICLGRCVM